MSRKQGADMNRLLALLLLPLIIAGCSNKPTEATTTIDGEIVGTWILIRQTTSSEGEFDLSRCRITFNDSGGVSGTDPCNELFGEYTVSGSSITMMVGGTKVGCNGADFREHLMAASRYSFVQGQVGTNLVLETPYGTMTFRSE
jgi:heat shock protein HslJ